MEPFGMPFTSASAARLSTCHDDLQRLFIEVEKAFPCLILEGHRGEIAQNAAYAAGKSKLRWPDGQHNKIPSRAVDAAPHPWDPKDRDRFVLFAGFVLGTATKLGIKLRWGGDWDSDLQTSDNKFDDLVHFELKD